MLTVAREIREAILAGRFQAYREEFWQARRMTEADDQGE
jgi:queuine/archaeosine tRNA-ribosyltransferase